MSKKRTEAESGRPNGEQTTEGSDPVYQQPDDAKRAKLVSLSDTTLQDLPFELLECILVKVVAMEVKDMKLAKSVWKEKADLVIDRLQTVCSQWSSICATDFFRNEIHRTLDGTAQETIRLEVLHQYPIQFPVFEITAMKDEVFILSGQHGDDYIINVLDCNNMAAVKDVITLPGIRPADIVGCSVSNCVYIRNVELDQSTKRASVLRITKAEEHQFEISPWINDLKLPLLTISVSANGNLITVSSRPKRISNPTTVSIYAANGFLQNEVVLSHDMYPLIKWFISVEVNNVIEKSNGNLVLVMDMGPNKDHLMEIDTSGSVVRLYQSALKGEIGMNFADIYGRILITNWENRFELLDSEFNRLDFTGLQPHEGKFCNPSKLHFNSKRNEIICTHHFDSSSALCILRFK